jgi:translation initiation factor IF-1
MDIKPTDQPQTSKQGKEIVQGIVIESLPNTLFKVQLEPRPGEEEGKVLLTFLGGKMVHNRIRVVIGDRVSVEIDPYGGKGRIVRRG